MLQASINECFLILIELVELICKAAVSYSPAVASLYQIDSIIEQLADFLRFIRELTHNYQYNGSKTHRNNSISIVFLLCRLLLFKKGETGNHEAKDLDKSLPLFEDTINKNITQKIKDMTLSPCKETLDSFTWPTLFQSPITTTVRDICESGSSSQLLSESSISATNEDIVNRSSVWRKELEILLFDYPLKHFYPDVHTLVVFTLEVSSKFLVSLLTHITNIILNMHFNHLTGIFATEQRHIKIIDESTRYTQTSRTIIERSKHAFR